MPPPPPNAAHYLAISTDSPSYWAPANAHTWFLHPVSHSTPPPLAYMKLFCAADFKGMQWGLHGIEQARESLSFTQLLRLHCFFRAHRSGFSSLWLANCHNPQLLRLYTQGTWAALASDNLGVWATMVEARVPHLLYRSRPVSQLLRQSSHLHDWLLPTPPPGTLIYAMAHAYMLCIYVGNLPLLQRLRKHDTAATACAEDSSFHDLLRITGLSEWTPIPLQFTADENEACFPERDLRYRLKP